VAPLGSTGRGLPLLLLCAPALAGPAWRDGRGPHDVAVAETLRLGELEVRVT
jgi:hypothetical protein